jgi:adenylate kinase
MRIIIFGAPGVGKGTQAKIIASELNIAHISTGDILRAAIKNETELGLKAKSIVETGGLVPDDIVAGMLKDALKEDRCKNGYILDGYPRTLAQAEVLAKIFSELGEETIHLIKLEAEDQVMINRISNRMVCSSCGNILTKDIVTENFTCPKCQSLDSYYKRKDDDEEVIKNRLNVYHAQTEQVFAFYKDKAHIIEIDGTRGIEEIKSDILTALKN